MAGILIALTIGLPWLGALCIMLINDRYPRWQHLLAVLFSVFGGLSALA
jgi:hypothetical protein